jgi:3-oxoacyl-[acyl-carrier protein] reductase
MKKKNVLITGASSGIGEASAILFAKDGHHVFGVGRNEKTLNAIKNKAIGQFTPVVCDLAKSDQIEKAVDQLSVDTIDALVNCAGVGKKGPIAELSLEQWNETMQVNVTASFLFVRHCLPLLMKSSFPSVVNVSSIAGRLRSLSLGSDYSTSNAALIGFTRHLAGELGPLGIRVNATCPSQTETPMLESALDTKQKKELAERVPLRRLATAVEQANVILFLCSESASYLNGAIIDVNGGLL